MPIQDELLKVRTASDGTLTSGTPCVKTVEINSTALKGLGLAVKCGTATGTTPTVKITIYHSSASAAASTDQVIAQKTGMEPSKQYIIPFSTQKRSVAFKFEAAGTSPNFATVEAWLTLNFGQDYNRGVEFN